MRRLAFSPRWPFPSMPMPKRISTRPHACSGSMAAPLPTSLASIRRVRCSRSIGDQSWPRRTSSRPWRRPIFPAWIPPVRSHPRNIRVGAAVIYTEPALKLAYPDGVRDVVLTFVSGHAEGDGITVEMADIRRPLHVTLRYAIDPATGIVGRSAVIRNDTASAVRIDQASSAAWSLPSGNDYRLHYSDRARDRRMDAPGPRHYRRRDRDREPPRLHRHAGQSLVRDRPRRL